MMDVPIRQKVTLQTVDLNNMKSQLNPTVIQSTEQIQNMLFFSSIHGTFSKIDHVYSNHSGMKLETQSRVE